ncbi:MAG: hypothetical protein HY513_04720 [Candidatus Aenigmarchaeota archaeon]|nr:hypothetical protein [Candidatus Aenigmarchaeota archaeon]
MKYIVPVLILSVILIAGCANYGSSVKTPLSDKNSGTEPYVESLTNETQAPYQGKEIHEENKNTNYEQIQKPLSTFRNAPELPSDYEKQQLPDCAGKLFTSYPIDLSKATEIIPLGNLAPPGHTFPTEHSYTHITAGGETTETIPLYAPGDVKLLLIAFSHGMTQDPVDYTLYFALCKDIVAYYNHVKEISPEIQAMIDKNSCKFQGESKTTRCNIEVFEPLKAGSTVGKVGRLQGNYDFGLIDLRTTLAFANPSRYGARSLHIQCPYNYYDSSMKSSFFKLIKRTDADKCGKTAQDVPGTLKGNWFYGNARADMGTDWDKYLAFVQDNKDSTISVISIGGVFADASKVEFKPASSGLVNREFSQVTPDGNIYCYESSTQTSSKIVVQMTSGIEIKIEKQNGSCSNSNVFTSNYKIYNR